MHASALRTAYLYARVSTDEQYVVNQVDFARDWAARHGFDIARVYPDEDVTGTLPFDERPQGRQLLTDLRRAAQDTGPIDAVLVYKLDRLGRDPAETMVAIKLIERAGARLISLTENFDDSSSGRLMRTLLAAFAGFERDQTLERSATAMAQLARKPNYYPGGIVAYGYRVEGEGRDAVLVVDEREIPLLGISPADVVRMIYHWLAYDGWSTFEVAEELTRRGIPPRYALDGRGIRGKRTSGIWRASRIRNLVINSTYKGVAVYGRRKEGKSPFPVPYTERQVPAIVDPETWQRAQATLRRKRIRPRQGQKRRYLLRGLVTCGTCGLNYSGFSYKTKQGERPFYKCNGASGFRGIYGERGEKCPNPTLNGRQTAAIWEEIDTWLDDPGEILDDLAAQLNASVGASDELTPEKERLSRALDAKELERGRLLTAYRKGLIDDDELDAELSAVRREASELEGAILNLETAAERLAERRAKLSTAATLLEELSAARRGGLSFEVQRQVVEALVTRIIVQPDGTAVVIYRFTPTRDNSDYTDTDSSRRQARNWLDT